MLKGSGVEIQANLKQQIFKITKAMLLKKRVKIQIERNLLRNKISKISS